MLSYRSVGVRYDYDYTYVGDWCLEKFELQVAGSGLLGKPKKSDYEGRVIITDLFGSL